MGCPGGKIKMAAVSAKWSMADANHRISKSYIKKIAADACGAQYWVFKYQS